MSGPALGERLLARRVARNLSLREAERECGVSFSTIARIERGEGGASREVEQALEAWLAGEARVLPLPPMTLRDWFAGHIVASLLLGKIGKGTAAQGVEDAFASTAYRIADALLAERAKATPTGDSA